MNRIAIAGLLASMALAGPASARVLWERCARSSADVRLSGAWQVTPEGWRKTRNGYRIDFTNLPPARANTRLSFDVRCFALDAKSRGAPHFGVYGTAGSEARFCIRSLYGGCMTVDLTTPCGTAMRRGLRNPFEPKFKFPIAATNPPVTRVEIDMRADSYALRLNGETVAYEKIAFPGLKSLYYQQYSADCAVDNFRLEELKTDEGTFPPSDPVVIPDDGRRVYPLAADAFSPRGGGFMFWFRHEPGPNRVSFRNAAGKELLGAAFADVFEFVHVAKAQGGTWDFRRRLCGQGRGDWIHVAFTWRPDGTCRFFLNGLPYTPGFSAGERFGYNVLGNGLAAPASVEVVNVKHPQARRDRIQGLKVFARPVENREVYADYRARMPIDAVLQEGLVAAERPVRPAFAVAPAGYYTRPKPVDVPDAPATVDLKLVLDGSVTQDFGRVTVDRPKDLALAPRVLSSGRHSLSLVVNGGAFVKTRTVTAGEMPDVTSVPATDDEWRTVGAPLVSRTFAKRGDFEFAEGDVREGELGGDRKSVV